MYEIIWHDIYANVYLVHMHGQPQADAGKFPVGKRKYCLRKTGHIFIESMKE